MEIIEPIFSDVEYYKRMNRFTLRSKKKVNSQWYLCSTVHNIGKCVPEYQKKYG
ncbi:transposase [Treponema primitia]|uniref:transposase n=1 Tax=Treponema primitia TaxID=88058 RepID=UPI0009D9D9C8